MRANKAFHKPQRLRLVFFGLEIRKQKSLFSVVMGRERHGKEIGEIRGVPTRYTSGVGSGLGGKQQKILF